MPSQDEQISSRFAAVILGIAVLCVYGTAIHSPFIYDDGTTIVDNPSIRRLWPLSIPLHPPIDSSTVHRPLVNLTLALNYSIGGLDPAGYHLANALIHFLNALLLMTIVRRTLLLEYFQNRFTDSARILALAAALLWAVHPLTTDAVNYVTQRTEVLVGFFYLATIAASLRYWLSSTAEDKTKWLIVASVCCIAGMACKEIMVSAPLIVLCYERTLIAGTFARSLRRSWRLYIGLAVSWGLLLALALQPRAHTAGFDMLPPPLWWATQTKVLMLYLKLALWPWPLAINYKIRYVLSLSEGWTWIIATGLLVAATLVGIWRRSAAGFVGAFCFAILAPTSIIPMPMEIASERRMYLPLMGIVTLIVVGAYRLMRGSAKTKIAIVGFTAAALAITLGLLSVHRLSVYRNAVTLWQDTAERQPNNELAHYNLGVALAAAGQHDQAIAHYQQALALVPNFYQAEDNLGIELAGEGKFDQALQHLQNALREEPNSAVRENNVAIVLSDLHRWPEAIEHFKKSIELRPQTQTYIELAQVYATTGQNSDALAALNAAMSMARDKHDRNLTDSIQMKISAIRQRAGG